MAYVTFADEHWHSMTNARVSPFIGSSERSVRAEASAPPRQPGQRGLSGQILPGTNARGTLKAEAAVAAGGASRFAGFGYLLGERRWDISDLAFPYIKPKKPPAGSAVAPPPRPHLAAPATDGVTAPGRLLQRGQFSGFNFFYLYFLYFISFSLSLVS